MPKESLSVTSQPAKSDAARTKPQPATLSPELALSPAPVRDFSKIMPEQISQLQRTIGNRAVADLLGRNDPRPASGGMVVGAANDRHEQEANQVARQVVGSGSGPVSPGARPPSVTPITPLVQKSPKRIQRLLDLEEFRTNTNKGTLRQRGDILTAVDTLIKKYKSYPVVVENDTDRNKRNNDLAEMRRIVDKWVERHDVNLMFNKVSNDKQGGQTDKSSSRRQAVDAILVWLRGTFIPAIDSEINTVTHVRTAEEMNQNLPLQNIPPVPPEDAEKRKKVAKYEKKQAKQKRGLDKKFAKVTTSTGNFFGKVLPTILRLLAPGPGDLGKFDLQLEFPVADAFGGVQAFVGGRVFLESEAKESNEFKAKFKGAFRTGVKSTGDVFKVALETGVQIEAQAQSAEEVSKLFNWGMYRRFRESDYIPRGITNKLWGGEKGTVGYKNAEDWAAETEKDVFLTGKNNEKAYVDLGFYAAGQGDVDFKVGKAGGEIFGYRGRKYTHDTVTKARESQYQGQNLNGPDDLIGKTNYTKKGAQKKIGQGSHRYELGGKVGIKPWYGDAKLKYESVRSKRKDTGDKDHHNKYRPHKYELEINAGVNLPLGGGLAQIIATSAGPGIAKMIRDIAFLTQTSDDKKKEIGTEMMAGQLGEIATGFETNIEYNQLQGSGLGSELHGVDSTTGANTASAGSKSAEFEGGFRFRLKITKEYALKRGSSSVKIDGSLYAVNAMGGSFLGNKVKLDRATRIGQIKYERGKKLKFELFGIAAVAEKKKANPNDPEPTWHGPKYQAPEAPKALRTR